MNEKTKEILQKIFSYGLGGVLMFGGSLVMIFHKKLEMEYPTYLIVGGIMLGVGFVIGLFDGILQAILKTKKLTMKLKTISDLMVIEHNIEGKDYKAMVERELG